jgi:hypothetical protein
MGNGWIDQCKEILEATGGELCNQNHCDDSQRSGAFEASCQKFGLGQPIALCECYNSSTNKYLTFNQLSAEEQAQIKKDPSHLYSKIMGKHCSALIKQDPVNWELLPCNCCCSCFAYDTPIAIPDGFKPIQNFLSNDQILVANAQRKDSKLQLSWYPAKVVFSHGTGPNGYEPVMIYMHYGEGQELICSVDQPFLMPNGKLKRADKLAPGADNLVLANGGTSPIHEIRLGEYEGGVHHIATGLEFKGVIDGHLLNTNGVVSGDYLLQLHQEELNKQGSFVKNHNELPTIGTPEYEMKNASLKVGLFSAQKPEVSKKRAPLTFRSFAGKEDDIPFDAQQFFSEEEDQALDGNAEKRPITQRVGISAFQYYTKIFRAFYPDILFYLDWTNIHTNAYSFKRYGQKIVLIPGGLLRLKALGTEGLVIIMAAQVARFCGQEPINEGGYTCTGASDYYGIGVILREIIFSNNWTTLVNSGLKQIDSLFKIIESVAPDDPTEANIDRPTRKCRWETMFAAAFAGQLPECAGGPTENGLKLEKAEPVQDGAASKLLVTFSRNLSPLAEKKENYALEPAGEVFNAEINPNNRKVVKLTIGCKPETNYTLTVINVTAADGSTLDPNVNSYRFRSPDSPSV